MQKPPEVPKSKIRCRASNLNINEDNIQVRHAKVTITSLLLNIATNGSLKPMATTPPILLFSTSRNK